MNQVDVSHSSHDDDKLKMELEKTKHQTEIEALRAKQKIDALEVERKQAEVYKARADAANSMAQIDKTKSEEKKNNSSANAEPFKSFAAVAGVVITAAALYLKTREK